MLKIKLPTAVIVANNENNNQEQKQKQQREHDDSRRRQRDTMICKTFSSSAENEYEDCSNGENENNNNNINKNKQQLISPQLTAVTAPVAVPAQRKNNNNKPSQSSYYSRTSNALDDLANQLKHILLPEEFESLEKGEGEDAEEEEGEETSTEQAAKRPKRKVAPLGTVPIFDNCDEVRLKLELIRRKYNNVSGAALCRAISTVSGRRVQGAQWKRFLLKRRGPYAGAESTVYADGYLFLEKLRIFNEEPKSKQRLENEKRLAEMGLMHGFERTDETRRTAMKIYRRG